MNAPDAADVPAVSEMPAALVAPLDGRRIIEASAGTGKTWTIAGLVARLVVERGLEVGRILVVSFSEAATAELRTRIRSKLAAMRDALDGAAAADDAFPAEWLARAALDDMQREQARKRVDAALRNFDDAAIFTIHGFCQRALAEQAFSGAQTFDVEITTERDALLAQVVADVWRRRVVHHDAEDATVVPVESHADFARVVIGAETAPAAMVRWMRGALAQHRAVIVGGAPPATWAAAARAARARWQAVRTGWPLAREAVRAAVVDGGLNAKKYQVRWLAGWLEALDAHCTGEDIPALVKKTRDLFNRFRASTLAAQAKGTPPRHPWFDALDVLFEAHDACIAQNAQLLAWFRRTSFEQARSQLGARMRANRQRGFDDLLVDLDAALDASHGAVAKHLAVRYHAMLIDEFQDTDPLQCAIFDKIHAAAPETAALYFVGDPKQAIYSFRGADLHTYLHASARAQRAGTLLENQRSTGALLDALDALFARRTPAFGLERIEYARAYASPRARPQLRVAGEAQAQAFVWLDLRFEQAPNRDASIAAAIDASAEAILRLLNGGATIDDARVRPSDIAVLVGDGSESERMKRALARRGIGSAGRSRKSVFASDEAHALLVLLTALAQPQHAGALRAALLLDLFGIDAVQLLALEHDEAAWQPWRERFARHAQRWRARGPAPMLRAVLFEHSGYARIAAGPDGERRLTNFAHLAELLQAEHARLNSPDAVVDWLSASIASARSGEAAELRLDSDANLVQIRTIHTSKGLEYPIVVVPTLWALRPHDSARAWEPVLFHDEDDVARLDFDAGESSRARMRREAFDERLRLAYVALTRAKQRCVVAVGALNDIDASPLGWWLLDAPGPRDDAPADDADDEGVKPDRAARHAEARAHIGAALAAHVAAARGHATIESIDVDALPRTAAPARLQIDAPVMRDAAVFSRGTLASLRVASFSALAHRIPEAAAELPEHDEYAPDVVQSEVVQAEPARLEAIDDARFAFARGADAGDVLHRIVERIDWSAGAQTWHAEVARHLARAGFAVDAGAMVAWLDAIARTPLPGACALRELPIRATRRELEFSMPLDAVDFARLSALGRTHDWALPEIEPGTWRGWLRGFIDLVFVDRARVHVVDYKSNWLGAQLADYDTAALERTMDRGGYRLQALLYLVALRRWLRVSGRRSAQLGAAHFLFVRGMTGRDGSGTLALTPPPALIDAVDALLAGSA